MNSTFQSQPNFVPFCFIREWYLTPHMNITVTYFKLFNYPTFSKSNIIIFPKWSWHCCSNCLSQIKFCLNLFCFQIKQAEKTRIKVIYLWARILFLFVIPSIVFFINCAIIYMYNYVTTRTHTHTHTHTLTYTHITHKHTHTPTHPHYIRTHTHITHKHTDTHYTQTHRHTDTHITHISHKQTHTYIYIYIYIYIRDCMCICCVCAFPYIYIYIYIYIYGIVYGRSQVSVKNIFLIWIKWSSLEKTTFDRILKTWFQNFKKLNSIFLFISICVSKFSEELLTSFGTQVKVRIFFIYK